MSKKRFIRNLDSLFEFGKEEVKTLFAEDNAKKPAKTKPSAKNSYRGKKKFTSDLDSLFESVLSKEKPAKSVSINTPRRSMTVRGLNALIRRTNDPDQVATDDEESKRVTFRYNQKSYDKLKAIAASKDTFVRDIIGEALDQYLLRYEKQFGRLN